MGRAALDAAIAAAVPEAQAELAGQAPPAPAPEPVEATASEDAERTTEVEEPVEPTTPEETPDPALDEATEPVDEYLFGIPITSIPEAERATFIKEWTEQNKTIQKLQRAQASETPPAPAVTEEQPVTVDDLSDEDIARAAGLDPEALDDPSVKVAVAALRGFAELKAEVEQLGSTTTAAEVEREWTKKLDQLDADYGELPIDRVRLLEIAADEGIIDPEAAYWRVAGPVRAEVMKALEAQLAKTTKTAKKAATAPRPKTSAEVTPKMKSTNVKDAVKEAADEAIRRLGITLSNG